MSKVLNKCNNATAKSVMSTGNSVASTKLRECFDKVVSRYVGALAAYQIWFTLRGQGKAIDTYLDDMSDHNHVDFFHATSSGNYKLMFIELASLFDTDEKSASIRSLKFMLNNENLSDFSTLLDSKLSKYRKLVSNILTVRSKIIAHKEIGAEPSELHNKHGIKPVEIKELLRDCSEALRKIEQHLTSNSSHSIICTTNRFEDATFSLLETLRKGRNS